MLASAGADSMVLLSNIQHGNLVAQLSSHTDTIYSLAFSREGRILATGEMTKFNRDFGYSVWDLAEKQIDNKIVPNPKYYFKCYCSTIIFNFQLCWIRTKFFFLAVMPSLVRVVEVITDSAANVCEWVCALKLASFFCFAINGTDQFKGLCISIKAKMSSVLPVQLLPCVL